MEVSDFWQRNLNTGMEVIAVQFCEGSATTNPPTNRWFSLDTIIPFTILTFLFVKFFL